MQIRKEKNNLIITFDYNPIVIEIVKKFDNRKFDVKTKEWSVPCLHVKKVLDILMPMGFKPTPDVLDIYQRKVKYDLRIENILDKKLEPEIDNRIKTTGLPLFDYQKLGVNFLEVTKSSILGDEPGTGKSLQSLTCTEINDMKKVLIVCPSSLKLNWRDEIIKWLKIKEEQIVIIDGPKKKRDIAWNQEEKFFIMNYELLLKDIDEIKKIYWDVIIADEATRISNPRAKQAQAIKKIPAKRKYALTGTPLNNSIQDIWSILDFCQPKLLGSYWHFIDKYCVKDFFGNVSGYKNLGELKEMIQQYMIRRPKSEVLKELPELMYENIYVEFTTKERQIYNALKEEIIAELKENEVLAFSNLKNALVKMVRLKQATGSLELISNYTISSKIFILKELLKDILHDDSKVLIYTQFAEMAKILERELNEYKPLLIIGEVDLKQRNANIIKFTDKDENKVMILTEAGNYGLNLQRAKYMIHYDLPWSISKIEQREGRAHRQGQTNKVTVFNLLVQDSIDEYILKILQRKQNMSEGMLGDKEKIKKVKITKKELRKILEV